MDIWLNSMDIWYYILLIHSSINGHLGCFNLLAIVNSVHVTFYKIIVIIEWQHNFDLPTNV